MVASSRVLKLDITDGIHDSDISHTIKPNVLIFGETGAGKSSIINMLDGGQMALVSDAAVGVTFSNTRYEKTIGGSAFNVFDTIGLNEGSAGKVPARDAIEALYKLMLQLADGVHLLVYVMRAPRITQFAQHNYNLFFDIFCNKKVPIVIIVTGLEDRDDMDQWWIENKDTFNLYGMSFSGHACITATRGKQMDGVYSYADEYKASKKRVETLLSVSWSETSYKLPTQSWFASTIIKMRSVFANALGIGPTVLSDELYRALRLYGGLSDREARKRANETKKKPIRIRLGMRFLARKKITR